MNLLRVTLFPTASAAVFALLATCAFAEPCPKVLTTTQTPATMRAIVKSINCLVETGGTPALAPASLKSAETRSNPPSGGTQVETVAIIGPQHTRVYPGFMLAILSMPVDNAQKSAIVNSDSPQAVIRGASGGECRLKLNSDHSIDAQCSQAGGTVFVVYR